MLRSRLARICVCVLNALRATLQVEDENLQKMGIFRICGLKDQCVYLFGSILWCVCRGGGGYRMMNGRLMMG